MNKEDLEKLYSDLEDKIYKIKEKLDYNPLEICGNEEQELEFDFAYYQGQKDLIDEIIKNNID